MSSIIIQLSKISKIISKEYNEIEDIILFGSFMRGKVSPNDMDILLLFKDKVNKDIEYDTQKLLSKIIKNISIISKIAENVKEISFDGREGMLFEGYSLIRSKFIASDFGFVSFGLFLYDTSGFSNTEKTRFYYALNGRASSGGIIDNIDGIKLSDSIIAVPLAKIEPAKEFFDHWKIKYKYIPSLIPQRLGRKSIIGKVR